MADIYCWTCWILLSPALVVIPAYCLHRTRNNHHTNTSNYVLTLLFSILFTAAGWAISPFLLPVIIVGGLLLLPIYLVSKMFDSFTVGNLKAKLRKVLE